MSVWIQSIAVCAVAAGIIYLVAPEGSVDKMVKTVVSLFMICIVVFPLLKGEIIDFGNDFLNTDYSYSRSDSLDRELKKETEEAVKKAIKKILEDEGIEIDCIKVSFKHEDDGEIYINKISVKLKGQNNDIEALEKLLYEKTGFEIKIES